MPFGLTQNQGTVSAFTLDDIIQTARDRTGNKPDVLQGEQFVPDTAIKPALRKAIIECNMAFGQSTARKETRFTTTPGPVLQTPGAPTVTPDTSGGVLPAGTYNYAITGTLGTGESYPSVTALIAATLGGTGEVTVTWPTLAYADGYNVYGRSATALQLLVHVPATQTSWLDTGIATLGSGPPTNNTTGAVMQQDYDVATYVGTDVRDIVDVLRSGAYVGDSTIQPMQVDPRTGVPFARAAFIDQAYQQNVLDRIAAQERFRKADGFDWEVVSVAGATKLRLMPPPTEAELVAVRYVASNDAIETLPAEAQDAMEYAACVAILDSVLNRVNSDPGGLNETARDRRYWLELVERQRDRYEAMYRNELAKRPGV